MKTPENDGSPYWGATSKEISKKENSDMSKLPGFTNQVNQDGK